MTRIMVVDDDKQATTMLEEFLLMEGYEPVVVNESSKTIETALATMPDLILLDLMMPEPDGFKVCRMLRKEPAFRRTPIIIVTALDDTDSRIVAFGAGADDYITKPYHIDELSKRIKKLLADTG
ncbi:MAG TPA: response regulator transcription factor [Anaerolineales bacterium]|nr:response regulator transcription factor [Anaerolineales bacterium]